MLHLLSQSSLIHPDQQTRRFQCHHSCRENMQMEMLKHTQLQKCSILFEDVWHVMDFNLKLVCTQLCTSNSGLRSIPIWKLIRNARKLTAFCCCHICITKCSRCHWVCAPSTPMAAGTAKNTQICGECFWPAALPHHYFVPTLFCHDFLLSALQEGYVTQQTQLLRVLTLTHIFFTARNM